MNEKKEKYKVKKVGPYFLLNEIGSGQSSTVYKSKLEELIINDGIPQKIYKRVAIKMIQVSNLSESRLKRVQQEIDILRKLEHKNIIRILDYRKSENHWYLVFEHCHHGDLHNYIKKYFDGKLPEKLAQTVIQQLAPAFQLMQEMNIVHRDLKLANILVDKDFVIKIGDFGFAHIMENDILMKSTVGTPITMGPEVLDGGPYNQMCDIWSIGIIIYQMIFGQPPFSPQLGKGIQGLKEEIKKEKIDFDINNKINISDSLKDLIQKMLVVNPIKRMKFEDFFKHPWVTGEYIIETEQQSDLNLRGPLNCIEQNNKIDDTNQNKLQQLQKKELNQSVKGRYEAILMMKISFQLRLFLEKKVVGFIAGCNTLNNLLKSDMINSKLNDCKNLCQILLSFRLQSFLIQEICLEHKNSQIVLQGYQKFSGYFLEKEENDINNLALILNKMYKKYKNVYNYLNQSQLNKEFSPEYLLLDSLMEQALSLNEQENEENAIKWQQLKLMSNVYKNLILPQNYLILDINSKKFGQEAIGNIIQNFSQGQFLKMTKFLKSPKLYEEFKKYEDLFNVSIRQNEDELDSKNYQQFNDLYTSFSDLLQEFNIW